MNLSPLLVAFTNGGSSGADSSEDAFGQLIREHGPMLARFVRYRIPNPSDAEDVLQETLVAAWLGFRRLRDPARMSSWLISIAQNRCRDYFRSQGRRELPLEEALNFQ